LILGLLRFSVCSKNFGGVDVWFLNGYIDFLSFLMGMIYVWLRCRVILDIIFVSDRFSVVILVFVLLVWSVIVLVTIVVGLLYL